MNKKLLSEHYMEEVLPSADSSTSLWFSEKEKNSVVASSATFNLGVLDAGTDKHNHIQSYSVETVCNISSSKLCQ